MNTATNTGRKYIHLARFLTAIRFLTVFPLYWRIEEDPQHFKKCLVFFPVIGLLIGLIGYCGTYVALLFFPHQLVVALAIAYLAFISGCLHLDGLADSADGLLGAHEKEQRLRIMKDSCTGAMGLVAVVFTILIKYSALGAMDPKTLCLAVFFMPLAGRCAILLTMSFLQYAGAEDGLGQLFYSSLTKTAALFGGSIFILLLAIIASSKFLFTILLLLLVNFLFSLWCKIRLGGTTGDTLGAICELTEMATAISFSASLFFLT